MSYQIILKKSAQEDIIAHKRSGNESLCRKIENLLLELAEHPREGTGKPEMLKGDLAGYWSRRINQEHRLVYSIEDETVTVSVVSAKGHYES
jgi:toxin YoeB